MRDKMLSFVAFDSMLEKHSRSSGILRAGAFDVDLGAGELRKDGHRVQLQEQPFQVLALLVERAGKVVTREEILQKLWPAGSLVDSGRSLDIAINKLHQALGDPAGSSAYFETVPGRGYRFIVRVNAVSGVSPPGARGGPAGGRTQLGRGRFFLGRRGTVALMVALAAGMALAAYVVLKWPPPLPGRIKLAVLPFNNLSGRPEDEHLSDGMTEEMITRLGWVQPARLGVIAATSVWPFKHTQDGIQQIGKRLGVDYIVEGSVFHESNQIRISAKLIQVSDATQLWTESYDRPYAGILSIESEVAASVADSLALRLLPAERARLVAPYAKSPEAHEAYLNGRYHWNKRTPDGFMKSIEYYNQAIAIDPNYAAAYAGLSDTYIMLGFYSISPPSQSFEKAKRAAVRALELDDSLAEAHASLADTRLHYDYDWEGAGKEFRRAIDLNPNYATAHQWYSVYLSLMGKEKEGLEQIQRAHDLDPLSLTIDSDAALNLFYARRYDQAIEQCKKTLELDPNFGLAHFWLGRVYQTKKIYPQAIAELRQANQLQPGNPLYLAVLGSAYGASGQPAEAQKIIGQLRDVATNHYISPVMVSLVYAGLGDKDQAIDWAEQAYAEHAPMLTRMKVDPLVDRLRSDPRFQALVRRVGPPD